MHARLAILVTVFTAMLALPLAADARQQAFPWYNYDLVRVNLVSEVTWDHTTVEDGRAYRYWGTERVVASLKRSYGASTLIWGGSLQGTLTGEYHYGDPDTSENCTSNWDISRTKANSNVVAVPRGARRALVNFGASLVGTQEAFVTYERDFLNPLDEGCRPGSTYSKAVGVGAGKAFSNVTETGTCDGYAYKCIVVPNRRFRAKTVRVGATATRQATVEGIPYTYKYTWSAVLKRGKKVKPSPF